jgi:hypothetical protein
MSAEESKKLLDAFSFLWDKKKELDQIKPILVSLSTWWTPAPWWIFFSWSLAPRRLELAWKLSNCLWKLQEVCITLKLLSGNPPSITFVIGVREE